MTDLDKALEWWGGMGGHYLRVDQHKVANRLRTLADAARKWAWLVESCETCGRTPGRVRMVKGKVISDALGWMEAESSPCPSCGGVGVKPSQQAIDAFHQGQYEHGPGEGRTEAGLQAVINQAGAKE